MFPRWILLLSLILSGCSFWSSKEKITWHQGSYAKALNKAKNEDKPLFVYWGAEWCPPCNIVKENVFTDKGFIKASQAFVPVYLDGDMEEAQSIGSQLGVSSYPTMLVLNPKGEVVVQLSHLLPVAEITKSLAASYGLIQDLPSLAKELSRRDTFSEQEMDRIAVLANAIFAVEDTSTKRELALDLLQIASKLESKSPEQKALLQTQALLLALSDKEKETVVTEQNKENFVDAFKDIISSQEKILWVSPKIEYYFFPLAKKLLPQKNHEETVHSFDKKMKALRKHKDFSLESKVASYRPLMDFHTEQKEQLKFTPEEEKEFFQLYKEALQASETSKMRNGIASSLAWLLFMSDYKDKAVQLLQDEVKAGRNPAYNMIHLSYIYEEMKDFDKSLHWSQKAYNREDGGASRIQWGVSHLKGLVKQKPDDKPQIKAFFAKYIKDSLGRSDAFLGRNKRSLQKAQATVKSWLKKEEKTSKVALPKEAFGEFKSLTKKACQAHQASHPDHFKSSCEEFTKAWES